MNLNILKIIKSESCCKYIVCLYDSIKSIDFSEVYEKKCYMSLSKVNTLMDVKKGDDLYVLDSCNENNVFYRPKLTKKFVEAKIIMEKITNQYVESYGRASKNIVNNVCIEHNTYSNNSIKSFEKSIDVANHYLIIAIQKVKVN